MIVSPLTVFLKKIYDENIDLSNRYDTPTQTKKQKFTNLDMKNVEAEYDILEIVEPAENIPIQTAIQKITMQLTAQV